MGRLGALADLPDMATAEGHDQENLTVCPVVAARSVARKHPFFGCKGVAAPIRMESSKHGTLE